MEKGFEKSILPFKIQQLIEVIIEKKKKSLDEAFFYLYQSKLYEQLTAEASFLWQYSTLSLYNLLEKEKQKERKNKKYESKVTLFQTFCLENYKDYHKIKAIDAFHIFSKNLVFSYLEQTHETLHTQGRDYIIKEIDQFLKNKSRLK